MHLLYLRTINERIKTIACLFFNLSNLYFMLISYLTFILNTSYKNSCPSADI